MDAQRVDLSTYPPYPYMPLLSKEKKKSVFSRMIAHAFCLCLLNKKKGSPSTILMMDWWMKDACENSQHLFAPLSSQHAAPISHA